MLHSLFGNSASLIQELQRFWQQAIPAWRNENELASVDCVGDPQHMLPLECLPLFDISGCDEGLEGKHDVLRACRSFIGFTCVVRRVLLPMTPALSRRLLSNGDGRFNLRFMHDDALAGARAELAWLSEEAGHTLRLFGPVPSSEESVRDLATQIYDPLWAQVGEAKRTSPDHILHLSCHCYTSTSANPYDYEVGLATGAYEVHLSLGALASEFVRLAAREERSTVDLPMVLLNACGSSVVDPATALSFPEVFLTNRNPAFVGTEVPIPDDVAALFSQEFYRALLLKGQSLGQAVNSARWALLRDHRSLLGLAYTVYGDTDLIFHPQKQR